MSVPYLEVRAGNTFGNLFKKRFLNLDKLSGLDDIEYLLNLPEEHDLLLGAGLRPELEEALDDLLGQGGVLLKELDHAVGQLSVVQRQTSNLRRQIIYNPQKYIIFISTLCRGISTLTRNCLCSAFKGRAKPLMIDPRISRSSPTPLKCSVS